MPDERPQLFISASSAENYRRDMWTGLCPRFPAKQSSLTTPRRAARGCVVYFALVFHLNPAFASERATGTPVSLPARKKGAVSKTVRVHRGELQRYRACGQTVRWNRGFLVKVILPPGGGSPIRLAGRSSRS